MNTKQRLEGAVNTETIVPEKDELVASGFTTEEIVSLLWLRQWYQTGGSDRVPIMHHEEYVIQHKHGGGSRDVVRFI